MNRAPWGHVSRHCARCGEVGPRCFSCSALGYIHARCRTEAEKREARQEYLDARKKAMQK